MICPTGRLRHFGERRGGACHHFAGVLRPLAHLREDCTARRLADKGGRIVYDQTEKTIAFDDASSNFWMPVLSFRLLPTRSDVRKRGVSSPDAGTITRSAASQAALVLPLAENRDLTLSPFITASRLDPADRISRSLPSAGSGCRDAAMIPEHGQAGQSICDSLFGSGRFR